MTIFYLHCVTILAVILLSLGVFPFFLVFFFFSSDSDDYVIAIFFGKTFQPI